MPARSALVDDLYGRFTAPGGPPSVTARDVALATRSPFSLWCEHHAPRDERDPDSAFNKLLKEKGIAHERNVLATRYPDATTVRFETEEEGFRALLDAMASGARAIAGLPLLHAPRGVRGRIDVLERRDDAPSVFGPWHYVVKEIKLAKNLRADHRLQAALYHWALGDVQGYLPLAFYLVNRDQEETACTLDEPELLATLRAARAIIEGRIRPEPTLGGGAPPWEGYADRCAVAARDVSLVDGVGGQTRAKLVAAGYRTVDELARARREQLLGVPGVGGKTADKLLRSATALTTNAPVHYATLSLPTARTEVYFDLEGTGENSEDDGLPTMDYLIGALVDGRYHAFVAPTADEAGERAMWREFVAWFEKLDEPILYHWHHYERTHLRKLAERHGLDPALHARLFASLADLHKVATAAVAFPVHGTSIKKIAPYCGFSWRQKSVNAMESIALYARYAEHGDRDALQKVLDYNEDDCVATRVVKEWLVANATSAPAP